MKLYMASSNLFLLLFSFSKRDISNIGVRLPGHQKRIAYSILGLQDPTGTMDLFAVWQCGWLKQTCSESAVELAQNGLENLAK